MGVFKKNKLMIAMSCALLTSSMSLSYAQDNPTTQQNRPNIILFLVDDMGWTDTSVQFAPTRVAANDFFRTPNMERIAETGVKFTQAYAHTVCSPSRISLMSGENPVRHHSTNWIMLANSDAQNGAWGPNKSPTDWRTEGMSATDTSLARLLKDSGYYTIHIGKAHFGALDTSGADPLNLGFDVNVAGHAAGAPASYQGEINFGNDLPVQDGYPQGVPGLDEYWGKDVHLTDVLTIKAEEEIEKSLSSGKPFFLNMWHYAVHTPIEPHKRFINNYQGKEYKGTHIGISKIEANYASLVEGMDASLGDLMKYLEEKGLAENTLIIFTSDNGGLSGHTRETTPRGTELNTHNYPLNAGKGSAYEGGSRVPYIVSWAKNNRDNLLQKEIPITPNTVSAQPIIIEDLFPTILTVAKSTAPLPKEYVVDGINTTQYWVKADRKDERALVTHYPHIWGPHGPGYEPHSTLHLGDYKVIYFYNSHIWELYNLKEDIGEAFNLAKSQPDRLQKLATVLKTKLIDMGAQWPVNRITNSDEPMYTPSELAKL